MHWNRRNQVRDKGEVGMSGEGKKRTSTSKRSVAKFAAALVALALLGVMASGALADGDPFSA
ncbi:MAG: hypothetical protein ACTHKS_12245, partial [Gaiellaceae bacterium]